MKSVQYNLALAITGAIKGTSKDNLYYELVFESLKDRRWLRRLCYLYKIANTKQPIHIYDLIPPFQRSSRNKGCTYEPFCRTISISIYLFSFSKIIQKFKIYIYIHTHTQTHTHACICYMCVYTVYAYVRVHIYIIIYISTATLGENRTCRRLICNKGVEQIKS